MADPSARTSNNPDELLEGLWSSAGTDLRPRLAPSDVLLQHELRIGPKLLHERLAACVHEPQNERERVNVNPVGVLLVPNYLRSHVAPCPDAAGHEWGRLDALQLAALQEPLGGHELADTEIGNLQVLALPEKQIQRLQIPVDDRERATVQETERA
eukprot:CAMPEP_0183416104 /NCGR_PEP_ID=MMETSP0370-20130417/23553_1 /TAXON_ID=268820 /ORGANISM="Peridinium aciculiferum, Strain PAER-2" /LENGTH=155 /DNA_ID=CAMNT_0025599597 /DNA_START=226 /DNA_END=691 /DNA_ORIENTATION=+